MVLSTCTTQRDRPADLAYSGRYALEPLPRYKLPDKPASKDTAYQLIRDELMLDGNPRFDLATFVGTWMEPEADKLCTEALSKNYINIFGYQVTSELQERCVNIIANMFHAPLEEGQAAVGTSTIGSSEAVMLACLAFKRKWEETRKAQGKPYDKPNMIAGADAHVCFDKFANYFGVEYRKVDLREDYYVLDPQEAVKLIDENTICVVAVLGSTYNGEFEDVKQLNDLVLANNKKTGLDTPIHVDAASGGFIAPFIYPELEWDFKLPTVKSINVSGHKYGFVYAGIGWVIWRSQEYLPDSLIFHVHYLGDDQPTFTLNYSKSASQIIAQYYQLVRLGYAGYKTIIKNCHENALAMKRGILATGRFNIISKDDGIPLVTFSLKDTTHYDEYPVARTLRRYGWIVPAYEMPAKVDNLTVLRVLIREDISGNLVERFLNDLKLVLEELDKTPARIIKELHNKVSIKAAATGKKISFIC